MELTRNSTPDQREPGRNGNEVVLHNPQSFRTEASDAVQYHTQYFGGGELAHSKPCSEGVV